MSSSDQDRHRNRWDPSHEEDDPENDESPSIEGSEWED